jgi:aminoglycoside phosphotransferase (APT) family kinase protein
MATTSNAHARELRSEQVLELLAAAGIGADRVVQVAALSGGTYNTAYRIRLADGTGAVLKVSPEPSAPILRYEQRIMRTEALFCEMAQRCAAPVPAVLHAGFDTGIIEGDFILLAECPGDPWPDVDARIGASTRSGLRYQLGQMVASLHTLTGAGFGYPTQAVAPLTSSWRRAFLAMVDAVLADARRFAATLPRPADEIASTFEANSDALDQVPTPVLVHFDLWDGNILLDLADGEPRIGGLIDAERAFWGDPLADLVSLALLGDIATDAAFLAGYRAAGGRLVLDEPAARRLAMYRCYLYLIMLVEAEPRGYGDAARGWLAQRVVPQLLAELSTLSS